MLDGEAPTLIVQSSEHDSADDEPHVERVVIPERDIPIPRILDMLGDRGVQSLLVEGGADTWARFLSAGMVDRARICVSPVELEGGVARFDRASLSDSLDLVSSTEVSGDSIEWWSRA